MPENACLFFWKCQRCGELLRPRKGDCCVFCSYGNVPCPPVQRKKTNRTGIFRISGTLIGGGILTALLASSCCILPLLTGVLGIAGAGTAQVLDPFRPLFTGLSLLFLGWGWWRVWKNRPKENQNTENTDCTRCCESSRTSGFRFSWKTQLVLMGGATILAGGILAFPWLVALVSPSSPHDPSVHRTSTIRAVLLIQGMTCAGCAEHVRKSLESSPCVQQVEYVDYEDGLAVVVLRNSQQEGYIPPEIQACLRSAIESAGYTLFQIQSAHTDSSLMGIR